MSPEESAAGTRSTSKVGSGSISKKLFHQAEKAGLGGAAEFAMSAGSFQAGFTEGVLKSIWDTLAGLKDAAVMVWNFLKSIIQWTIIEKLKQIWTALQHLPEAFKKGWKSFKRKWSNPSPIKRRQFRGALAGRVTGEIALAIITAGAAIAIKGAAGAGRFAKFIRALKPVQKMVSAVEKRKRKLQPLMKRLKKIKKCNCRLAK